MDSRSSLRNSTPGVLLSVSPLCFSRNLVGTFYLWTYVIYHYTLHNGSWLPRLVVTTISKCDTKDIIHVHSSCRPTWKTVKESQQLCVTYPRISNMFHSMQMTFFCLYAHLKGLTMIFAGQENPLIIFRSKEIYIYFKTNNKIHINLLK